jgi:type IVB pilus formation R64 PilN family outer membrane protein
VKKNLLFVLLSTALLSSCSILNVDRTASRVEQQQEQASEIVESLRSQKQTPARETVVRVSDVWVSKKPIKKHNIPEGLRCEIAINAEKAPIDILEFAHVITKLCRIPARVTLDALQAIQGKFAATVTDTTKGTSSGASTRSLSIPPLPAFPQTSGALISSSDLTGMSTRSRMIDFKYQGKLESLLDMAAQRLGISWKFADGTISFFHLGTRVFHLAAVALSTDFSSIVQSGMMTTTGTSAGSSDSSTSSGVSGTSGSQQNATVAMKTSVWDDVSKAITSMLTPDVGRISVSPSSGTIIVTDTSEVLDRIGRFLDGENKALTKQILFNVKVVAVSITDSDGIGIDWGLVYNSLSGNYGFSLSNVTERDASAINATVSVLSTATGSAARYAGSSAVISALAQQGRVSTLRSPSVMTLNLHAVPIQIGSQVSYVASAQTTNTAQVGSSTSLTPGTVTTGFNMILLPYVLPDNVMLLQSSINISALNRIRSVTSAGTTIEVPEVNNQIFSQTARIRPGETLILSGFESVAEESDKSGVGTPNNILLGGSLKSSNTRDVIVVLITPIIQE